MRNILFSILIVSLRVVTAIGQSVTDLNGLPIQRDTMTYFDTSRSREIPIAVYHRINSKVSDTSPVVIISHGYNENRKGSYLGYSFLANHLAANGFIVVSIQHELPEDSLIPMTGIPQVVRRPFWDRGADNIYFVINELKKQHPNWDYGHICLIGHSNGGDMTALFPQKYPGIVDKIITLDNRRMALPRSAQPEVLSLRSSDQVADEGVLPTNEEMDKYGIKIISLKNTTHNEMCDNANEEQRAEIRTIVLSFLTNTKN